VGEAFVQSGLTELNDTVDTRDRIAATIEASVPAANEPRLRPPASATETQFDRTIQTPESAERAFWSWLGFWVQMLVLTALTMIGAFAASGAERSGDYVCGMVLTLAAIALAFMRLKHRLDGGGSGISEFLLVTDMWNLALVIPLFTVIGLAGLFIAHGSEGGALHIAGVALFLASGGAIFLDMKHVFDRMEGAGRR
jgi:hypothetical protein